MTLSAKQQLQEALLELQKNMLKLGVADWSETAVCLPIAVENPDEQAEICVQMAVLKHLFGQECYAKLELEAYLWCRHPQELLRRLGWLEGGIVVLDKHRSSVRLPHVDFPHHSLRLPMIRPYQDAGGGLRAKMAPACFAKSWEAVVGTISDAATSSPNALGRLGDLVYDRDGPTSAGDGVFEAIHAIACQYAAKLFPHAAGSIPRVRIQETVLEHLTALVENQYLRNLRLGSSHPDPLDFGYRAEFLRFFGTEAEKVSTVEEITKTLFVPDGEVSLLLLEYLMSSDDANVGGHRLTRGCGSEQWDTLGFADLGRITRLARFVRDLLGLGDFDRGEHEAYKPILGGTSWEWLRKLSEDPNARCRIQAATAELLERPTLLALTLFCEAAQLTSTTRTKSEVQQLSPIALPIHLYLRQDEVTNRALLAFPLTGWELKDKSTIFRNIVVYFVGTIHPAATDILADQLEYLRSFVSIACWPTVSRLIERDDETMQRTANVLGHDLTNRLAEIRFEETLSLLRRHSTDTATTDRPAQTLQAHLDMLYGTAELFNSVAKISSGNLPAGWMDDRWKSNWPPVAYSEECVASVEMACEDVIRYVGQCYAQSVQGKSDVFLRRLDAKDRRVLQSERLGEIRVSDPEVHFAPFDRKNSAGPQAVLAGLTELVRNALKVVTKNDQMQDLIERYGMLHIDYAISRKATWTVVELWNPKWRARLRVSTSIRSLTWMYSQIKAIRIDEVKLEPYNGKQYAYSRFSIDPTKLKFESGVENA